jgi:hypothetical protein
MTESARRLGFFPGRRARHASPRDAGDGGYKDEQVFLGMHPGAERELSECQAVYGVRFRQEVNQWLAAVAAKAAEGQEFGGGYDPALPEGLQFVTSERLRAWLFAAQVFRRKEFLEQLKALFQAARTRKPPYEYFYSRRKNLAVAAGSGNLNPRS